MKILNLEKTYGEKTVLKIDEFTFAPNKIYAIIGTNGCGKSTFLKIISGTIKSDAGRKAIVDYEGEKMVFMPQKNHAFMMSVEKNILVASGKDRKKIEMAQSLMKSMKIDHLRKQPASKLSGGETARMALCRTLMSGATIVLLDEPTAAMDIESTLLSEKLISDYRDKNGATVVMVTHSVGQAKRIADEVIFMKDGTIIESGSADKVLYSPDNEETKKFLEFFSSEI